jgi:hypothetical protein
LDVNIGFKLLIIFKKNETAKQWARPSFKRRCCSH